MLAVTRRPSTRFPLAIVCAHFSFDEFWGISLSLSLFLFAFHDWNEHELPYCTNIAFRSLPPASKNLAVCLYPFGVSTPIRFPRFSEHVQRELVGQPVSLGDIGWPVRNWNEFSLVRPLEGGALVETSKKTWIALKFTSELNTLPSSAVRCAYRSSSRRFSETRAFIRGTTLTCNH